MNETQNKQSNSDPKAVDCPTCGAKAGNWCKRPSGHSGPMVAFHATRRKAAEAVLATDNTGCQSVTGSRSE